MIATSTADSDSVSTILLTGRVLRDEKEAGEEHCQEAEARCAV